MRHLWIGTSGWTYKDWRYAFEFRDPSWYEPREARGVRSVEGMDNRLPLDSALRIPHSALAKNRDREAGQRSTAP